MDPRAFQLLEFPKVLEALAGFAVSGPGGRACRSLSPLDDLDELVRAAVLVEETGRLISQTGFTLSEFPDLRGIWSALDNPLHVLDLDDLAALGHVLGQAKGVRRSLEETTDPLESLRELIGSLPWPAKVDKALERCLGSDGRLGDDASPELFVIRQEIRSIHRTCTRKVKEFVEERGIGGYLQDDYVTISSDRYVLPLKSNFKGRLDGVIHDYSQTGETCYFEPLFLVELNNQMQTLKREERAEERKVLKYLTDLCRNEFKGLVSLFDFLVDMDVLAAKTALGRALGGRTLLPEPVKGFSLLAARHPLLALSGVDVRPVDISLEPTQYALVISGGNAGGKTVCLKTLGLVSLMSLCALPVPVEAGSRLPFWRKIYVSLGDEQSLEENVSTFTAQIRSLRRIWDEIDEDTLVIMDEFGAGTDPTQGSALAQATIDSLLERHARVAAATHFPGLKAYGLATEGVRSASVMFDPRSRKPLYQLAYDQAGASIALEVARDQGLPEEILDKASQYLLLDGSDTTQVMERLNSLAVERARELEQARDARRKLEAEQKRLKAEVESQKRELAQEIKARSQEIVRQWQKGRMQRKQALKELARQREKLAPEPVAPESADSDTKTVDFEDVREGWTVFYRPWGREGLVVEKDERKKGLKLDLGGVSLWADAADVGRAGGNQDASSKASSPTKRTASASAAKPGDEVYQGGLVLDLRGRRAEAAVSELERFLDRSLLRGLSRVEVIHGKGTGALRREVHEFLDRSPMVDSYGLASETEGGEGKTLVDLA